MNLDDQCMHAHTHTCHACTHARTHTRTHAHTFTNPFVLWAAVTPTISQVTDDTVDLSPTLVTGGTLTLTCTAMGTPRPQVNWFRGDTLINIDSRTQITRDPDGTSTLLSTLTISSTTTGDSGAYQCQVENAAGTTSLQYQVTVGEYIVHYAHALQLCVYSTVYVTICNIRNINVPFHFYSV